MPLIRAWLRRLFGLAPKTCSCPFCRGTGHFANSLDACPVCDGEGEVSNI
jgi:DnaJ-class molecular chaperone